MQRSCLDEHPDLHERLAQQDCSAQLWTYEEVFALPDEQTEDERIALLPQRASPRKSSLR